jgi:hypothetical protein
MWLEATRRSRRFSRVESCGMSCWTTVENASKTEWS